jgi:hypothetical protein
MQTNELLAQIDRAHKAISVRHLPASVKTNSSMVDSLVAWAEENEPLRMDGQIGPLDTGFEIFGSGDHSAERIKLLGRIAREAVKRGVRDETQLSETVEAVFRRSGLWPKTDTGKDAERLLAITNYNIPEAIANALQYAPSAIRTASIQTENAPRLNLADGLLTFSNDLPPPRDFVIHDLILAAKSALWAGLGGVSKSQLLMQAAICTVLGLSFMGRSTKAGAAMLFFGEEDAEEIFRRVNAIAKVMRLTGEQLDLVKKRLRAFPMVGLDVRLTVPIGGALENSGLAQEMITKAKELEAECGLPVRLIGLDHLGLIHGGDFNAREDSVQTMVQVNHVAKETGAAVIVLAHSPKASIGKDQANSADVAGSAGFVDQSRGVFILRTMDAAEGKRYGIDPEECKNYVSLTNVKANYTRNGDVIWMERRTVEGYEVSVLHHAVMHEPVKEPKGGNHKIRAAIIELVKERNCLSKDSLIGFAGAKDGLIRAGKDTVRAELEMMLADGHLAFRDPTSEERKRLRIKGQTNGFLTVVTQ